MDLCPWRGYGSAEVDVYTSDDTKQCGACHKGINGSLLMWLVLTREPRKPSQRRLLTLFLKGEENFSNGGLLQAM